MYVIFVGLNVCFIVCYIILNLSWVRWNIMVVWVDVVIFFNKKKKNLFKLKELIRYDKICLNMFFLFINNGNYSFFYCFNYFYKWLEELFVYVICIIFEVWIFQFDVLVVLVWGFFCFQGFFYLIDCFFQCVQVCVCVIVLVRI